MAYEPLPGSRLPWRPTRSQSQRGLHKEKQAMKKRGAKASPRSGAGKIKYDGRTDDDLIEHKEAAKTHALNGEVLRRGYLAALNEDRDFLYVVQFSNGVLAEVRVTMGGS